MSVFGVLFIFAKLLFPAFLWLTQTQTKTQTHTETEIETCVAVTCSTSHRATWLKFSFLNSSCSRVSENASVNSENACLVFWVFYMTHICDTHFFLNCVTCMRVSFAFSVLFRLSYIYVVKDPFFVLCYVVHVWVSFAISLLFRLSYINGKEALFWEGCLTSYIYICESFFALCFLVFFCVVSCRIFVSRILAFAFWASSS